MAVIRSKKFWSITAIVVLVIIGVFVFTHRHKPTKVVVTNQHSQPINAKLSDEQLVDLIGDDDNPNITYTISSRDEPAPGWLVLKVVAKNKYGTFNQIAILQRQSDGSFEEVAGPDTSFPVSYLQSIGAPQAVISSVPTYQS